MHIYIYDITIHNIYYTYYSCFIFTINNNNYINNDIMNNKYYNL